MLQYPYINLNSGRKVTVMEFRKSKLHLPYVLFVLYCLLIVWVVVFKTSFNFREIEFFARPRSINLIPFYYDEEISTRFHLWEVLMNAILFAPFGVYLKILDTPSRKSILYGFFFSLALELFQFTFALGAADITDLITNTLGTAAGICFYAVISKIFKNKEKVNKGLCLVALTATLLLSTLIFLLYLANR